ncbi:hypothetical protein EZS27_021554, partial [termite gut metagenome]
NRCSKASISSGFSFIYLILRQIYGLYATSSNKCDIILFLLLMCIVILILSFAIYNQRQTISQYKDNDLKYRYIKMQGQAAENNIYRLDRQFRYRDSVTIIRNQVKRYEQLVQEQAERIERARREAEEAEILQKETESLKRNSK